MKKLSEVPYDSRTVLAAISICNEKANIHTPARRIADQLRDRLPVIRSGAMSTQDVLTVLETITKCGGDGAIIAQRAIDALSVSGITPPPTRAHRGD